MSFDDATRRTMALGWAALLVTAIGCGYGEISPVAYQHSKSLYTVSNLRSSDSIERVEKAIARDLQAGKLPPHEAGWLSDICEHCRAARWEEAQAAARQMMEDQVRS